MDSRLMERLGNWHEQLEVVRKAEKIYFKFEARSKTEEARGFLKAEGKTNEERKAKALASEEMEAFRLEWFELNAEYLHQRRVLDHMIKEFDAEYITYKQEGDAIKKHP